MARRNSLAQRIISISLIILVGVGLTLFSLRYQQPSNCQELCTDFQPCQVGQCKFGEQRAGFPLPFVQDAEAGSPTTGWGKIGPEDYYYADIPAFTFNVACYSLTLWLLQRLMKRLFQALRLKR